MKQLDAESMRDTYDPMMRSLNPLRRRKRSTEETDELDEIEQLARAEEEVMDEEIALNELELEPNRTLNYSAIVFTRAGPVAGPSSVSQYVLKTCGKSSKLTQRVVNGEDVEDGKYPWMAAVLKLGDAWCGGVILNKLWIITASHCFMK